MHRGIELRITTPAGVVMQCDSDFAHDVNVFAGFPVGEWRTVMRHFQAGTPVLEEGQADVAPGQLPALLTIELRAVELLDVELLADDAAELFDEDGAAREWGPGGAVVEGGQAAAAVNRGGDAATVPWWRRPGRSRWLMGGRWRPGRRRW